MSAHQQRRVECHKRSLHNCFYPRWKLNSQLMNTKVSHIASQCIPIHSLPSSHHKRWTRMRTVGYGHMHQKRLELLVGG